MSNGPKGECAVLCSSCSFPVCESVGHLRNKDLWKVIRVVELPDLRAEGNSSLHATGNLSVALLLYLCRGSDRRWDARTPFNFSLVFSTFYVAFLQFNGDGWGRGCAIRGSLAVSWSPAPSSIVPSPMSQLQRLRVSCKHHKAHAKTAKSYALHDLFPSPPPRSVQHDISCNV